MPPRFLRLLSAAAPSGDVTSDAELLRKYVASGDADAFELLVRRHADTVWNACLRVLGNEADAADAFQATFLILTRRAATVRGTCAGGWLHRVAANTARRLRTRRRPTVEANFDETIAPGPVLGERLERDEFAAAVHEELAQFPERYRLPVVLCDLEGHTHSEAAKVLGWPVGSVSGRLSRAHAMLRARLARRGFVAPVLFVACAVPSRIVQAAIGIGTGAIAAPTLVSHLTEGVLLSMHAAKMKVATLLAVGFLGAVGLGVVFAAERPNAPAVAVAPEQDDDKPEPDPKTTRDPKWVEGSTPSAYPGIPAITSQFLTDFEQKHVEPIFVGDTPLRKLLKMKSKRTLQKLTDATNYVENTKSPDIRTNPNAFFGFRENLSRNCGALSRLMTEAQAIAFEIYPTAELRRPWLVLKVAVRKRVELLHIENPSIFVADEGRSARIDTEIELARHDQKK
ncbi:RNA polymerase sigma factor [Gemmata sp. SH-PL17]|uniref:RNA polymerase sigma factor n=1 Tax=Gemmata sp. SH-PL17 TaxID=1630693 RepID=UPI000695C187|nr:sigma-70 family RNA polymerase sigma factor [Gemmata sp. SH-PL17]